MVRLPLPSFSTLCFTANWSKLGIRKMVYGDDDELCVTQKKHSILFWIKYHLLMKFWEIFDNLLMNIWEIFENQILKVENTSLLLATGICQAPSRPFHISQNINRNTNISQNIIKLDYLVSQFCHKWILWLIMIIF